MPSPPAVVLDETTGAFLRQGVSILAASRTLDNVPRVSRATGCRILDDRRLLIYLPTSRSRQLLDAIEASGAIAVVFSEIESHKTIQIKGNDARVSELPADCASDIARYADAVCRELVALDYDGAMARALVGVDVSDVTGVAFTPRAIFDQTPGPGAGKPMERR